MKNLDKKTLIIAGVTIFGMISLVVIAAVAVPRALVTLTKAAPATKVSVRDSYVIGEVILAKADGKDKNIVNVFVLDENSKGVSGKTVSLDTDGMETENMFKVSDSDGKASFDLVSEKEGQFEIGASIEGVPLNNSIKVTFRN